MNTELILDPNFQLSWRQKRTVFRLFLSKAVYQKISDNELSFLWTLSLEFYDRSRNQPFLGFSRIQLGYLLKTLRDYLVDGKIQRKGLVDNELVIDLILGPHQFYGLLGSKDVQFFLKDVRSFAVLEKKKYPPQRFIGVGYKDKGSKRMLNLDGSPDWKEVLSNHPTLRNRIEVTYSDPLLDWTPEQYQINLMAFPKTITKKYRKSEN